MFQITGRRFVVVFPSSFVHCIFEMNEKTTFHVEKTQHDAPIFVFAYCQTNVIISVFLCYNDYTIKSLFLVAHGR